MAQEVFWNWKADDLTIKLTQAQNGLFDPGLYRGFDFLPDNQTSMTLVLTQDVTGFKEIDKDLVETSFKGLVRTKQGCIIKEDAPAEIIIEPAHATLPRIDTIYINHRYREVTGGEAATYTVATGTPDAAPEAPTVPDYTTDTVIGYLYVPAAAADLADPLVVYTRELSPSFAAQDTAFLSRVNRFTKMNQEYQQLEVIYPDASGRLTIPATGNVFQVDNIEDVDIRLITAFPAGTRIRLYFGVGWTNNNDGSDKAIIHIGYASPLEVGYSYWFLQNQNQDRTFIKPSAYADIIFINGADLGFEDPVALVEFHSTTGIVNGTTTNFWTRAQMHPFAAPSGATLVGCRLKNVSYTVSAVVYTAWILELDSRSDNFILDLANTAQLNGFNPTTDKLELRFMDVLQSEFYQTFSDQRANGWCPKIVIRRSTVGTTTLTGVLGTNPVPTGTTYFNCRNLGDLTNLASNGDIILGEAITTTKYESLEFSMQGQRNYCLFPISTLLNNLGSVSYTNNTFFADGVSYQEAISALAAELKGELTVTSSVALADLSGITSGNATINYKRIGKHVSFEGVASVLPNALQSNLAFTQTLPNSWTFLAGQTVHGAGMFINADSDEFAAIRVAGSGSTKLYFAIFGVDTLSADNSGAYFSGSFLIN